MPPAEPAPGSGSSRPLPRALLLLAAALLVARVGTGVWEERHPPAVEERVSWRPLDEARAESEQTHRPILYEFSADWCAPCQAMSREVFSDPDAARRIEAWYIPVRVLDRQQEEGRNPAAVDSLQRAYAINGFPTLIVAWPDRPEFRSTSGYRGRQQTLQWLASNATGVRLPGIGATPGPRSR